MPTWVAAAVDRLWTHPVKSGRRNASVTSSARRTYLLMLRRAGWMVVVLLLGRSVYVESRPGTPPGDGPPSFDDPLNVLKQLQGPPGGDLFGSRAEFSGSFRVEQGTRQGRLSIEAKMQPGWHMYSTTQPDGGPRPTVIEVTASADSRSPALSRPTAIPRSTTIRLFPEFPWRSSRPRSRGRPRSRWPRDTDPETLEDPGHGQWPGV